MLFLWSIVFDCTQHQQTGLTPLPPSRGYECSVNGPKPLHNYYTVDIFVHYIYCYCKVYISVSYSVHICFAQCIYLYCTA